MGAYLIYSDWTDGTGATPLSSTSVPTVIKTWTLDQTDAYNIRVEVVFRITMLSATVSQTLNPTITIGSNTRTFAYNTNTGLATNRDDYLTAVFAAESRNGDVVTAQLNPSTATDNSVTVNVKSFEIIEYCP